MEKDIQVSRENCRVCKWGERGYSNWGSLSRAAARTGNLSMK